MINNLKIINKHKDNYQFGVMIPRNHKEAMDFDLKAGNNKWYNAEQTELKKFSIMGHLLIKRKISHLLMTTLGFAFILSMQLSMTVATKPD